MPLRKTPPRRERFTRLEDAESRHRREVVLNLKHRKIHHDLKAFIALGQDVNRPIYSRDAIAELWEQLQARQAEVSIKDLNGVATVVQVPRA